MTTLFVRRLGRARGAGWRAVAGLWTRTLTDVARTALAERWAQRNAIDEEGRMMTVLKDLTAAAHRLVRTPLFTLGAAAIVAFGIGVNAAAFSVVDAFLFRPPPFDDPDRVVRIFQDSDDGDPSSSSFPAYRDMTGFDAVFETVAAVSPDGATWERDEGNEPLAIAYVSASYLDALGLAPALGRWFEPAHDQVGEGLYAVVSHRMWRSRMGADPGVVGSTMRLDGQTVTVLGVGPEGFHGIYGPTVTDLWLSISSTPVGGPFRVSNLDRRQDHWYDVVARLADGVGVEQAQSAMDALAVRLAADFPDLNRGRDITVFRSSDVRLHPQVDGSLYPAAGLLLGVVGMILVLSCANLANLLLVRGMSRGPEVAVRRALGAGGGRVASLFLSEGLLLSALGGAAGLLLASWLLTVFARLPLPRPGGATLELGVDARVAAFTLLLVVVTGLLFGLAPALRAARSDVAGALREDGRSASAGRRAAAFRNTLVAVQVAVSIVLLVGTGILLRGLASVGAVDPGVDVERLAYVGVALPTGVTPGPETVVTFERVRERMAALPGVTAVARSTRLPVQGSGGTTTRFVEGYVAPAGTGNVELNYNLVDESYFETVGIPVEAGRAFTLDDAAGTDGVVIVSGTAARRFWSGAGGAVGGRIRAESAESPWANVVGVVGDAKVRSLDEADTPYLYFPLSRSAVGRLYFLVRTDASPAGLASGLRAAVREVDASLDVFAAGPLEAHVATSLDPLRAASLAMGGFSLLAILLATLGIYAVVAFVVARRTAELGIRIALGAARRRIVGMVVRDTLVTVGVGMAAGLSIAALVLPRVAEATLGAGRLDPVAFGGGAALFLAVSALAAWVPARRAARADPVDALRAR
jgi:predicted permease